ncbi:MAG: hypothetical protein R3Y29_05985 [bacterium]
MNTLENNKLDILKILVIIFCISFTGIGILIKYQNNILEKNTDGLDVIEYLNSQVQRVTKLELEFDFSNTLISILDDHSMELSEYKYFSKNQSITKLVQDYSKEFQVFKEELLNFRIVGQRDDLFNASEHHYVLSVIITKAVKTHIDNLSNSITRLNNILILHICIIAGLLIKILINTNYELYKNTNISKDMFLDISTGIYNSSKCHEILNNITNSLEYEGRAVLIFDLSDSKKDANIKIFANYLKEACNLFVYDIFVGRYSHSVFMVYFTDTIEKDIELYINEINFFVNRDSLNDSSKKILYDFGYCIANNNNKLLSTYELFEIAMFNVYKNKLQLKYKKKKNKK